MLHPLTQQGLTDQLLTAERIQEHHGWDLAPNLLALFHHPWSPHPHLVHSDSPVDPAVWHDLPTGAQDPRPAVALHHLADTLATAPMRTWLRDWLHKDGRVCLGFALVFEAWIGAAHPTYRHGDLAQAPPSDRVEARVVAAADIGGRIHRIIRVRGAHTPTADSWAAPPPRIRDTRIATALTRLVQLAHRQ
ncbi:hypothetical protein [Micromonospora sp. NPDC047134]|uniref:hypothetical protein n=1 Tax=Micromonospora sp. NPDC047134 TaxID=3154340 RepID=UPI0033C41F7F